MNLLEKNPDPDHPQFPAYWREAGKVSVLPQRVRTEESAKTSHSQKAQGEHSTLLYPILPHSNRFYPIPLYSTLFYSILLYSTLFHPILPDSTLPISSELDIARKHYLTILYHHLLICYPTFSRQGLRSFECPMSTILINCYYAM